MMVSICKFDRIFKADLSRDSLIFKAGDGTKAKDDDSQIFAGCFSFPPNPVNTRCYRHVRMCIIKIFPEF
jgi:hypothetical protein